MDTERVSNHILVGDWCHDNLKLFEKELRSKPTKNLYQLQNTIQFDERSKTCLI